jgi:hypothetical protein
MLVDLLNWPYIYELQGALHIDLPSKTFDELEIGHVFFAVQQDFVLPRYPADSDGIDEDDVEILVDHTSVFMKAGPSRVIVLDDCTDDLDSESLQELSTVLISHQDKFYCAQDVNDSTTDEDDEDYEEEEDD